MEISLEIINILQDMLLPGLNSILKHEDYCNPMGV